MIKVEEYKGVSIYRDDVGYKANCLNQTKKLKMLNISDHDGNTLNNDIPYYSFFVKSNKNFLTNISSFAPLESDLKNIKKQIDIALEERIDEAKRLRGLRNISKSIKISFNNNSVLFGYQYVNKSEVYNNGRLIRDYYLPLNFTINDILYSFYRNIVTNYNQGETGFNFIKN